MKDNKYTCHFCKQDLDVTLADSQVQINPSNCILCDVEYNFWFPFSDPSNSINGPIKLFKYKFHTFYKEKKFLLSVYPDDNQTRLYQIPSQIFDTWKLIHIYDNLVDKITPSNFASKLPFLLTFS